MSEVIEGILLASIGIAVALFIGFKMTKEFRDSLKVDKS